MGFSVDSINLSLNVGSLSAATLIDFMDDRLLIFFSYALDIVDLAKAQYCNAKLSSDILLSAMLT